MVVVHKRVATLDTRLAEMEGKLVSNPLERNLGFYDFGRYTAVKKQAEHAFEKINDPWNEEISAELDSDDDAKDESTMEKEMGIETDEKQGRVTEAKSELEDEKARSK
jgi:hypothetical protein